MSTVLRRPGRLYGDGRPATASVAERGAVRADPRLQAFTTLRIGYTLLPIVMGIDKFFNAMTSWPQYLADWIDNIVPGTAQQFMYFVGGVEILAGLIVALRPRYGAYIVAAWLAGIVINLLSYGEWYDIAVRDFGLMLGALALGRLASVYDRRTA
jgi:uncharacterized membrane protein YphA (DoxX/SURF4 family)